MAKHNNGCEKRRCDEGREVFEMLGKCWTGLIIRDLLDGPRRFRKILLDIGDINDKVLSGRLKELEALGVINRTVYPEAPVRVEYALTEKGRDLERAIEEMEGWSQRWQTVKTQQHETN
jgi:DNA-binding HxlR family transcriptional regulator